MMIIVVRVTDIYGQTRTRSAHSFHVDRLDMGSHRRIVGGVDSNA